MEPQQPCEFIHLAATEKDKEKFVRIDAIRSVTVLPHAVRLDLGNPECDFVVGEQAASLLSFLRANSGNW